MEGDDLMVDAKTIDEEYLKEVDRKVEMIPLTFDVVLKGIFDRNRDLLKKFVVSVLKLDINIDDTTVELSNNELTKENVKEYQKRVAREDALKEGLEQGIKKGIEQNILSMLDNGVTLEFVSKVTGKTIDEINEIRNSL